MKLQLRKLRENHHMTQTELAEKVETTLRKISAWERGETSIPLEDACNIADFFGITLDELAGRWEYVNKIQSATPDELRLVDDYRKSDERGKGNILDVAKREKIASKRDVVPVEDEVK